MSFLTDVVKEVGNEYTSLVSEGVAAGDVTSFIDTGSYIFNALLSGSIYGGVPSNKITAFAGETGTGKTFFTLSVVKNFLNSHPDACVFYFESESAISKEMFENRGIVSSRVAIFPISTFQEFRQSSIKILDKYLKVPKEERTPMMFCLDSFGNLSTTKEMEDTESGKEVRDMTRPQIIKSLFRVLTLKLGEANVPLIVTNHTYDIIGSYVPAKEMSGGSGLKYAASTIVYLSKAKEKEGTDVVGGVIKCKTKKSRFSRPDAEASVRLYYDKRGLDRYYGLIELAKKHDVLKFVGNRCDINNKFIYPKTILSNPEEYFSPELMNQLDTAAQQEYEYGQ